MKLGTKNKRCVQILKACHSYNYQSCENNGYYDSLAYAIIEKIIKDTTMNLDGYDEAEWDIADDFCEKQERDIWQFRK